jgi:hypothetical protein
MRGSETHLLGELTETIRFPVYEIRNGAGLVIRADRHMVPLLFFDWIAPIDSSRLLFT